VNKTIRSFAVAAFVIGCSGYDPYGLNDKKTTPSTDGGILGTGGSASSAGTSSTVEVESAGTGGTSHPCISIRSNTPGEKDPCTKEEGTAGAPQEEGGAAGMPSEGEAGAPSDDTPPTGTGGGCSMSGTGGSITVKSGCLPPGGAGGMPSSGGTGGSLAGMAGAPQAGMPGTGGSSSGAGGTSSDAGAGGSGGIPSEAGSSGSGGTPSEGGKAGSSGSAGAGGSPSHPPAHDFKTLVFVPDSSASVQFDFISPDENAFTCGKTTGYAPDPLGIQDFKSACWTPGRNRANDIVFDVYVNGLSVANLEAEARIYLFPYPDFSWLVAHFGDPGALLADETLIRELNTGTGRWQFRLPAR
jgi:hypothetical protein